ncbi:MAG: LysR substrate-binding domain-containing protein [Burkholderiaceae bacterium]
MSFSKQSLARRLKLQQMAIFDKVLSSGSLLAASRELHMTQPALTKAIQELEEHFGRPLLIRTRRGVQATEFGRMLHTHCQSLLSDLRLLADDLNAWNAGISGQVIVGTLIAASAQLLPTAVLRMREIAPQVVVEVRVGVNETMFQALARGELDVVVGLLPAVEVDPNLEHVALYDETLCAVVGRQHPLATQPQIEPAQLESADWVIPTPASEAIHATAQFFEALGIRPPAHSVESVSLLTNLGLVLQSQMVALMPFSVARQFVRTGLLSILPLGHGSPFGRIGYTTYRGREPTPAGERLLLALREVAPTLS